MPSKQSDTPFFLAYLLVLACQGPLWMCGGLLWGTFMVVLNDLHPVNAFVGGLAWGFFMWVFVGNLFAIGLAWRQSATLPVTDRQAFRAALDRACSKVRHVVLAESPDELVLGPKRALVRFRLQEVRITFEAGGVTLTGPALWFGAVKKALVRALAERPGDARKPHMNGGA